MGSSLRALLMKGLLHVVRFDEFLEEGIQTLLLFPPLLTFHLIKLHVAINHKRSTEVWLVQVVGARTEVVHGVQELEIRRILIRMCHPAIREAIHLALGRRLGCL